MRSSAEKFTEWMSFISKCKMNDVKVPKNLEKFISFSEPQVLITSNGREKLQRIQEVLTEKFGLFIFPISLESTLEGYGKGKILKAPYNLVVYLFTEYFPSRGIYYIINHDSAEMIVKLFLSKEGEKLNPKTLKVHKCRDINKERYMLVFNTLDEILL